jgi:pimeloyl-ACP methyl ester carboxylesterase
MDRLTNRRLVALAAGVLACGLALSTASAQKAPAEHAKGKPALVVEEIGSFYVGGQRFFTELGNSTEPHDTRNPGTVIINQTYVEYIIPKKKHFPYPILMMPGGGHTQHVFETTPDGREGWATYFPRKGMSTYLSDGVNRGSSSWDLTNVVLARQGEVSTTAIPSIDRYTFETAWAGFRIGPSFGVQYPGNQFPVEAFEQYANQLVPAFRHAAVENPKNIAALVAAVDKIGPVVVLGWSQSGLFILQAALQRPNLVKGLIFIDSGSGNTAAAALTRQQIASISHIPALALDGDFRAAPTTTADILGDNATNIWLPQIGITGNGHTLMVERNNLEIADVILDWIKKNVKKQRPARSH